MNPPPTPPGTRRGLTTAALMSLMALSAVEATVVSTAMPTVIADLGGVDLYGWVAAAYFLTVTVATPIYGKLADSLGRKPVALMSVALFLLGSLACGAAGSIGWLIAARALQGVGAGGMQPVTLTIIGDLYPLEERGKVQGAMSAVWATASVAGPLLGGWIVHAASWRWVFWVNIPVGVLGVAVLLRAYHEAPRARGRSAVDLAGAALFTASTVSLLLGAHGTLAAVTLPLAAVTAALFVVVEGRAQDPVLPIQLLRERVIAATSASGLMLGAAMMTSLVMLPLFAQGALRLAPAQAGSSVAPMLFGWPVAAFVTSRVLARVGPRAPMLLGSLLIAASLLTLAQALRADITLGVLQGLMLVYGLGMGLVSTASLLAVQSSVPWSQRGVATAVNLFARAIGGALGTGGFGALLAYRLRDAAPSELVRAVLDLDGAQRVGAAQAAVVAQALTHAMRPIFAALAALAVLNALVVTAVPRALRRAEG